MLRESFRRAARGASPGLTAALFFAFAGLALGLPARSPATSLLALDLGALSAWADVIALVRCSDTWAERRDDGIWTVAVLEPLEVWKGAAQDPLRIEQPGGIVGRLAARASGLPRFRTGQESVVFLQRFPTGDHGVIGLFQGKLDLELDADGTPFVRRSATDIPVAADPADHGRRADGGPTPDLALDRGAIHLLGMGARVDAQGRIALADLHDAVVRALEATEGTGGSLR